MVLQNIINAPNSGWISFLTTVTATTTAPSFGSGSSQTSSYLQSGKSLSIAYTFYQTGGGSAGSGTYLFSLPSGFTINNSVVPFSPGGVISNWLPNCGNGAVGGASLQTSVLVIPYNSTNYAIATLTPSGPSYGLLSSSNVYSLSNGQLFYNFFATIPIN